MGQGESNGEMPSQVGFYVELRDLQNAIRVRSAERRHA